MKRILSAQVAEQKTSTVKMAGWVNGRRDHGGLIFIDMRDHTGLTQLVFKPEDKDLFAAAESLRDEYVIEVEGVVLERDDSLKNSNIVSGGVEIEVQSMELLNAAETPPFQVSGAQNVNEDTRLKHRYIDLRRPKMQHMLAKRAEFYSYMRRYMEEQDFIEVSTPILANSSPEGARDFIVPSRLHQGSFYALPQAPQQFKQLLMVGGIPRYYQMAACFRDEDPRSDRLYGEFYQLDLEMSFVQDGEEVRSTMDPLITRLVTDFADKSVLGGEIPRITYKEAMDRYGSDKPDLRYGLELVDLSGIAKTCSFGVFSSAVEKGGVVKALAAPADFTRKQIDQLTDKAKELGAGGLPYMSMKDGQLSSSIAKFFSDDELQGIAEAMSLKEGDTVLFGADKAAVVNRVLGGLRSHLGDALDLKDSSVVSLLWIVDFPFYEKDDKTGQLDFGHNPFSMPKGGRAALAAENKEEIIADQYDMVMNGYEICSGGVRNHQPETMYEVFGVLGYDRDYVESRFGGMLSAFKYGAPPHAGCAYGLDRMFMVLMDEDNIREVVAFPKNGSGVDLLMQAPSTLESTQLKELGIRKS